MLYEEEPHEEVPFVEVPREELGLEEALHEEDPWGASNFPSPLRQVGQRDQGPFPTVPLPGADGECRAWRTARGGGGRGGGGRGRGARGWQANTCPSTRPW